MKIPPILLLFCSFGGVTYAQSPTNLVKQASFTDDNGQRISFELPQNWRFEGGIIYNAAGRKAGEFTPGTIADCHYKSGTDFIKELRAGYPDDVSNPQFLGSRILVIDKTTWTEGIRNVPAWDGKRNAGRWYMHSCFALLSKRCFEITFYSQQKQLSNEDPFEKVLASIKLL